MLTAPTDKTGLSTSTMAGHAICEKGLVRVPGRVLYFLEALVPISPILLLLLR